MVHTNVKRATWLLTLVLTLVLSVAPLSATANQLVMTTPAQNSVLTIAPNQVTITSASTLQDMGNQLSVTAPDGSRVDDGSITVVDKSLTVGLKPLTIGGTYQVNYELISINDSPLQGTFTFIFNAPAVISSPSAAPVVSAEPQPTSSSRTADYFVIGLLVLAFFVLIGISRMARNTFRK
jgi:methionine-rich copper-binding protein CopC